MERDIVTLMGRIAAQSTKKTLWSDHDGPYEIAQMIGDEHRELVEAIEHDGGPFEVGSEIGDVLYLALKLCAELGFNPADLIEMKLLRNDMKYPTDQQSHGEYGQARIEAKQFWQAMGGDIAFSHAYLNASADHD